MSLINDALKRAKQAQQPTPAPASPGPPFRAAEPPPLVSSPPGIQFIPTALVVIAGAIGLLLCWQWIQKGHPVSHATSAPTQAKAPAPPLRSPAPPVASPGRVVAQDSNPKVASMTRPAVAAAPAPASRPAVISSAAQPVAAKPALAPAPVVPATASTPKVPTGIAATPQPALVQPTATQPTPLKLQAIFYHPNRPSAMISGQTVHIGERVAGWRVLAINRSSATLTAVGQTNVLSLVPQ